MIALRNRRAPRLPRRERGVVLMIALIVLVALTLAGLSMVRSVDTGSTIAGNFAFRQAALSAADAGVEAAFAVLNGATGTGNGVVQTAPDNQVSNKYYPVMQATDADGIPTGITWTSAYGLADVPAGVTSVSVPTGYDVRFVIERMCTGAFPVIDVAGKCVNERTTDAAGGSVGIGRPRFTGATKTNYRVTVRVEGPRNTVSMAQAVMAF